MSAVIHRSVPLPGRTLSFILLTDCEYVAKRKDHLIKHIEFVHRKVKPFSCAQCAFTASQRGAINRHISAVHRKEKPFLCQYCGFSASFKGNLKQHVQKVHEKFACPIDGCQYRTATQPDLDMHLTVVHEAAAALKCAQCNIYCSSLTDLNGHYVKEHFHQQQHHQMHPQQQQ
jgi:KRAB domain-containing zinc finger protein